MTILFPSAPPRGRPDPQREEPSQAEIRRATAAIREHWSPQKRLSRSGEITDPMTVTEAECLAKRSGYSADNSP
jgi:hypothetical protein